MTFMNVGASQGGSAFASKAALKRAIKAEMENTFPNDPPVRFRATSPMGPQGVSTLGDLISRNESEVLTLTVVGPDPQTDRRWYASVKVVKRTDKATGVIVTGVVVE